jgi:hypothetical protein
VNLKQVLMEMGNKLVTQHGFAPSIAHRQTVESQPQHLHSTHWIGVLTEAINQSPEMRYVLSDLGIDWPMPGGQHDRMDEGVKADDGEAPQRHQ